MPGEVRIVLGAVFIVVALALAFSPFLAIYVITVGFLLLAWGIDAYGARDRYERQRYLRESEYYAQYPAPPAPSSPGPAAEPSVAPAATSSCGGCGGPTWFTPRTGRGFCDRCALYS